MTVNMRATLPADIYKYLRKTIDEGTSLDLNVTNAVAEAMKNWAVEHGAMHFTYWFQPLTGITAEKHESFITPSPDGSIVETMEIPDHPFYVGVQFHPEFKSQPNRPHPLFCGFVQKAMRRTT